MFNQNCMFVKYLRQKFMLAGLPVRNDVRPLLTVCSHPWVPHSAQQPWFCLICVCVALMSSRHCTGLLRFGHCKQLGCTRTHMCPTKGFDCKQMNGKGAYNANTKTTMSTAFNALKAFIVPTQFLPASIQAVIPWLNNTYEYTSASLPKSQYQYAKPNWQNRGVS